MTDKQVADKMRMHLNEAHAMRQKLVAAKYHVSIRDGGMNDGILSTVVKTTTVQL